MTLPKPPWLPEPVRWSSEEALDGGGGGRGAHLLEAVVLLAVGAVPAVTVPVGHHCVLVAEPAVDDGVCWLHPADEDRVESVGGQETREGGRQAGRGPRGWRCRQVEEGAGDAMNLSMDLGFSSANQAKPP